MMKIKKPWHLMQVMHDNHGFLDITVRGRYATKLGAKADAKWYRSIPRGPLCVKYNTYFTYFVVKK